MIKVYVSCADFLPRLYCGLYHFGFSRIFSCIPSFLSPVNGVICSANMLPSFSTKTKLLCVPLTPIFSWSLAHGLTWQWLFTIYDFRHVKYAIYDPHGPE